MAEGKRYYWIKLRDDFFQSKRIKYLRKLAGGDTYTIIYLKMQLKAMKNDGYLRYTNVGKSFAEELAVDIDEEECNVAQTISYLMNVGLVETSDNINFFIPYSVENVGSEGASAKRVRDFRERAEEYREEYRALQSNADVTRVKRLSNGEIEKEIEKEKEKELEIDKGRKMDVFSEAAGDNEELLEAFRNFEEMRKKIKAPLTEAAKKVLVNKLVHFREEDWIPMLNESITNDWKSVYPLKSEGGNRDGKSIHRDAQTGAEPGESKWGIKHSNKP